jgi:hypothetical protein
LISKSRGPDEQKDMSNDAAMITILLVILVPLVSIALASHRQKYLHTARELAAIHAIAPSWPEMLFHDVAQLVRGLTFIAFGLALAFWVFTWDWSVYSTPLAQLTLLGLIEATVKATAAAGLFVWLFRRLLRKRINFLFEKA